MHDALLPWSEHHVVQHLLLQGPLIALFGRCGEHAVNPHEPTQPHVCLMVTQHREGWHLCACGVRWLASPLT